jgi:rubrerythrin
MTGARDFLLEAIKRPALRVLHLTPAGEGLIVRLYLEAEQHAERAAPWERWLASGPRWLRAWLEQHRAEERRHAALFAAHLAALGQTRPAARGFDWVSRRKLRALHGLIERFGPRFAAGPVVAALAVALRMEEMGVRVFNRHVEVLEQTAPAARLLPVLRAVRADERRHARACSAALRRLVLPAESADLEELLRRIDRTERRAGVWGALAMFVAGGVSWIKHELASFISPSRTGAAT